MTGGDGAKSYDWYAKNTASATFMDANTTNAGKATISCNTTNSGLSPSAVTAPMIYKILSGDFDVSTHFTDANYSSYTGTGLAVFSTSDITMYNYIIRYWGSPNIAARHSDGTDESTLGTDVGSSMTYFRLTRVGNLFTFYRKENSGDSWTTHASVTDSAIGSSIWVALFAQTGNAFGTYVTQLDWFGAQE